MKIVLGPIVILTIILWTSCGSRFVKQDQKDQGSIYININDDSQFFSLLNLDFPGMGEVRKYYKMGNLGIAKIAYLEFRRKQSKVKWNINPYDRLDKASSSDYPGAGKIMNHIIDATEGAPETFVGKDINWEFNPVDPSAPNYTREWTFSSLNRMSFWDTLSRAYWSTLNEKYAREWVDQMVDWVEDNPVPMDKKANETLSWRTIEAGIRMSGSWMNAYYSFLLSSSFTPDANLSFVKGVIEHGQRLEKITLDYPERTGNWVTMECNGLGTIGILFPEIKKAKDYLRVAFDRMNKELDKQVYPDGAEIELTPGYHQVSRSNFMELAKLAQKNNIILPEGYIGKLEKMYTYNLYLMDPAGNLPPFNDASVESALNSLKEGYEVWNNKEFLYGSTLGKEGQKPRFDSYFFNWAGYYVMRNGWNYSDNCLYFDAGPVGSGHEHEDMLNLYLYSHGKILLTESGTYTYDQSKWRRYVLSTPAHNTIMVDGKEQHRGDDRASRLIKEPLKNPWVNSPLFDYGKGTYSSGYQNKKYSVDHIETKEYVGKKDSAISHTRHVIFLKPWYYIAVDFLEGKDEHSYDAHFHLNAPDANIIEATKAVHTQRSDSVQLGLFPMDVKNLKVKVVKGQEDPVLGWFPEEKRPIPTVVYSKKEKAPSTFATFLYPYLMTKPEVSYRKIMADNKNLWGENIITPYESISLVIRRYEEKTTMDIRPEIVPAFSVNADLILIRKPKDEISIYLGFYNLSDYKGDNLFFNLTLPSTLNMVKRGNRVFYFNPQENEFEVTFSVPFNRKFIFPTKKWFEVTPSGIEELKEKMVL
jgi:hypothetical protein